MCDVRKAERNRQFMMVFRMIIGLLILAAAGFWLLNRRKNRRQPPVSERRPETGTGIEHIEEEDTAGEGAARDCVTRADCWRRYEEFCYEKMVTVRCKKVFTDTAIFYYLERLMGLAHDKNRRCEWQDRKKMILYCIDEGIEGALRYRKQIQTAAWEEAALPDRSSFHPDIDEDTYYYQMRLEKELSAQNRKRVREEYERLEREMKLHLYDKNTIFYRELWQRFQPCLRELHAYAEKLRTSSAGTQPVSDMALWQDFEEMMERIQIFMKAEGVLFLYGDEASGEQIKRYFKVTGEGKESLAVIRLSDGYVYYMGQTHSRSEKGERQDEGARQ